ncbi:MAG: TIGR04086 family membrane protein [Clostridia bacterium]|nr:TIGR04086 family membrane protein [Clostridia bacterium]
METESERNVILNLKVIAKTVVTAFLITIILMGVLALLICYTPISEEAITPSVYVLNYFSVFMAGLLSAARAKRRGFVTGGLSGGLYMLLVYFLGYLLFGGIEFTKAVAMNILYCLVLGIIGGVVGINIRR